LKLSINEWYLVHGLALCKTIHELQDEKRQDFAKMQISARKDVDKCFGYYDLNLLSFKTH